MLQDSFKKSFSIGIEIVVFISIALLFLVLMLFIVMPQISSANHTMIGFGDRIISTFTPT